MKDPGIHCSVKPASVAQQHVTLTDETTAQMKKQNIKLWQWSLKLQEASNTSLLQPQNGDVPEEEVKTEKLKSHMGSAEAQSGGMSEQIMENSKVKNNYCQNLPF